MFRISALPARHRLPRRVLVYSLIALAALFAVWLVVGAARARGVAATVAEQAAASFPGHDGAPVSRVAVSQAAANIEEAESQLASLRWWILPLRAAAPVLKRLSGAPRDAGWAPTLVDYVTETLRGGRPLIETASEAAQRDHPATLEGLEQVVALIEEHRPSLETGRRHLERAALLRSGVDEERLSPAARGKLRSVDRLRELLTAAMSVADGAPEIAALATSTQKKVEKLFAQVSEASIENAFQLGRKFVKERATLEESIADIDNHLKALRPSLETLAPALPLAIEDVDEAIDYALEVLGEFGELGDALVSIPQLAGGGFARNDSDAAELKAALDALVKKTDSLIETLDSSPDLPGLPTFPEQGRVALENLGNLGSFLRHFLGYNREQVHIILAQDDEELRASGGFLGALWILRVRDGQLVERRFMNSYAIDEGESPRFLTSAPDTFALGMGSRAMPFRDQNWWADFPFAAEQIRNSFARSQARRPNTVIAINQGTIEGLLAAIGPVDVGEAGHVKTVGEANARRFLETGLPRPANAGVPADWDDQRYASYLLGNAVLKWLSSGAAGGGENVAVSLARAASLGDLLISAGDPVGRSLFRRLGWDGALEKFDADGFFLVESNAFAPKISHVVSRTMSHEVSLSATGDAVGALTLTYTNPSAGNSARCVQPALEPNPPCYWVVLRIYLPENADVDRPSSMPLPSGVFTTGFGAAGTDTVRVADGADGLPLPVKEISGLGVVPPGQTREWTFRYSVPGVATKDRHGVWTYRLSVPHQPGLRNATLSAKVKLPDGACFIGSDPELVFEDSAARGSFMLEADQEIVVRYATDPAGCAALGLNGGTGPPPSLTVHGSLANPG